LETIVTGQLSACMVFDYLTYNSDVKSFAQPQGGNGLLLLLTQMQLRNDELTLQRNRKKMD
jgi:hypothetical protein